MKSPRLLVAGSAALTVLMLALVQSPRDAAGAAPHNVCLHVGAAESQSCPMTMHFSLPRAAAVYLTIRDPNGSVVQSILDAQLPAGDHTAVWDGRNDRGQLVDGNAYLAVLQTDRGVVSQPFVVRAARSKGARGI